MSTQRNDPTASGEPRPSVALLIETSNRYSRELLQGIRDHLRRHGGWALHLTEQGRGGEPPPWLASWRGQGIIARVENRGIERAVRKVGAPVVNVSASGLAPDWPAVISDSAGVARMAAEHLVERGLRYFGYCGDARFKWSASHGDSFAEFLDGRGFGCSRFRSRKEDFLDWESEQRRLGEWIMSLPKPCGVMACYDIRGQQLLDVCRRLGVKAPDEVAVIGQHDDDLLCELCDPPLSSVRPNPREAGYRAAEILRRMMDGKGVEPGPYRIAPLGVATRQSTDMVAIDDPRMAEALRFMRENACAGIGVADIVQKAAMSRTLFERRYRQLFQISPYEGIVGLRVRRASELLLTTDLPVGEICARAGFSSPEYFSAAFKKRTGVGPRAFRTRGAGGNADVGG